MQSRRSRTPVLAGFVVAAATLASPASAQPCGPDEVAKLLASDGATGDEFGFSVSASGDTAVIGAPQDDDNGSISGSAYVFRHDGTGWVQEAKLLPADGSADDWFGRSVSVSGDVAVIGAPFDDDNGIASGSAYVFRFDGAGWTQEAKLLAADRAEGDDFGDSVFVSGDTAVIGAPSDDDNGSFSGSAYIFRFNGTGWVQEAKLLPADGSAEDRFGRWSVSVSGDVAVIGAPFDDDNGIASGSAYVFHFDGAGWTQEAKLLAADRAEGDDFGFSVFVSGDTAVIGAPSDDDNGSFSGSAYVFRFDGTGWVQEAKFLPADGSADDWFGTSVSVSGDVAVIGAPSDDDNGSFSGSAYVFRFDGTGWVEEAKLLASNGEASDQFGLSVSVSGETAVIGARGGDGNDALSSGSAYIFDLNCMDVCLPDTNGDGVLTPTDFTAWINAFNNQLPECDQNGDGSCTPTDFTAWIANFNAGC